MYIHVYIYIYILFLSRGGGGWGGLNHVRGSENCLEMQKEILSYSTNTMRNKLSCVFFSGNDALCSVDHHRPQSLELRAQSWIMTLRYRAESRTTTSASYVYIYIYI